MDELIEALTIARKYMSESEAKYPTGCEHDVLWLNVDVDKISAADLERLEQLSFFPSEEYAGSLISFTFGSC